VNGAGDVYQRRTRSGGDGDGGGGSGRQAKKPGRKQMRATKSGNRR
jgi:hypothetical protein